MEKFLDELIEAESIIRKIDHMLYVTYPLVKDKKILLKILVESKIAVVKCINYILQYEYLYKRIRLTKDSKENMRIFKVKCAPRYNISVEQIRMISKLFEIIEMHKKSPLEFQKQEKIVILSETSRPEVVGIEDIKNFLGLAKNILKEIKESRKIWF